MTIERINPVSGSNKDRVIIFDTTLRDGEQSPGATMTFEEKLEVADLLDALGVDIFYILPFEQEMAVMSDEAFARDVLVGGLHQHERQVLPRLLQARGRHVGGALHAVELIGRDELLVDQLLRAHDLLIGISAVGIRLRQCGPRGADFLRARASLQRCQRVARGRGLRACALRGQ